jgi:hypothetical protein
VAGADEEVLLAGEQEAEREGAPQPRQRRRDGVDRRSAAAHLVGDELGDDLGVGLGLEADAAGGEVGLQLAEVLDDAVMDHGEPVGRMRMRIGLVRLPVRRPAGVADPDRPREGRLRELDLEVAELALGPAPGELAGFERRDAGRVIAPVLQPLEGLDDLRRDGRLTENSDNSTHAPTTWLVVHWRDATGETGQSQINLHDRMYHLPKTSL